MTSPTDFGIGTTSSTTHLGDLTVPIPNPKAPFAFYSEQVQMASGLVVGRGLPVVVWEWGFLTRDQRDQLRQYCTGASAVVYIDTQSNDTDDSFEQYKAVMKWPITENREAGRRVPFRLEFVQCIKQ